MKSYSVFSPLSIVLCLAFSGGLANLALAEVSVSIPEATWAFEIKYGFLSGEKAQLDSKEQAIARKLKELLREKNYQKAWQTLQGVDLATASAALLQIKGQIALELNKLDSAIPLFEQALKKRSDLLPSHRALGAIYLKKQQHGKAREHLLQAVRYGDQDAGLLAQLAYMHMEDNHSHSAVAGFRQALFLAPGDKNYQQGLLWALTSSGDLSSARSLLNQLINADHDNADLWLRAAQIALQLGDEPAALGHLEVALRLGAKGRSNQILCAQLHISHGSAGKAAALLGQSIGADEKYLGSIVEALGMLAARDMSAIDNKLIGKLDQHQNLLSKQLRSTYLVLKATRHEKKQQFSAAQKMYQQAISFDATNGHALMGLATLLMNTNKPAQADMYFVRAAGMEEFQEGAWLASAQIALNSGSYQRALDLLRKVYQKNPQRGDLLANIKQIQQLQKAI